MLSGFVVHSSACDLITGLISFVASAFPLSRGSGRFTALRELF